MGRNSKNPKPQSGIPGLIWRQRGGGGSWVVCLNVPIAMRGRVVSSTGKPLTRLERSTGTDSLSLAKKLYADVMSGLRAELDDRAGGGLETPLASATRAIANRYVTATSEQTISELDAFRHESLMAWRETQLNSIRNSDVPDDFKTQLIGELEYEEERHDEWAENQWLNLRVRLPMQEVIAAMPGLSAHEKQKLCASLDAVLIKAKQEIKAKRADPFFYEPSQHDQKLREAAAAPLPASFDQALQFKRAEVSERTYFNIVGSVKKWETIIASKALSSITTSNLNRFARELKKPKAEGGYGFTTEGANNAAVRVRSLIKTFNVNQVEDENRLLWPVWDPVRLTTAEKKAFKTKVTAISLEDAKKLLSYARALEDDSAWRALLILANTTFRVTEATMLRWADIKEKDGIAYFDLADSKTVDGIRRVPLNSRLKRHLLPLRGADDEFIINNGWPRMKSPKDGLGQWLRNAKEVLGIEGNTNAHSFRHAAGGDLGYNLPEHTKKKLMGHSGGMTDRYTREDMKALSKAVEYIGFDF